MGGFFVNDGSFIMNDLFVVYNEQIEFHNRYTSKLNNSIKKMERYIMTQEIIDKHGFDGLMNFFPYQNFSNLSPLIKHTHQIDISCEALESISGSYTWFKNNGKFDYDDPLCKKFHNSTILKKGRRFLESDSRIFVILRRVFLNGWDMFVKECHLKNGIGWDHVDIECALKCDDPDTFLYHLKKHTEWPQDLSDISTIIHMTIKHIYRWNDVLGYILNHFKADIPDELYITAKYKNNERTNFCQ
jgi:hypothetical protein